MKDKNGYYKGWLELNGFKTTFIVYADSNKEAKTKALDGINGAIIHALKGPYKSIRL